MAPAGSVGGAVQKTDKSPLDKGFLDGYNLPAAGQKPVFVAFYDKILLQRGIIVVTINVDAIPRFRLVPKNAKHGGNCV